MKFSALFILGIILTLSLYSPVRAIFGSLMSIGGLITTFDTMFRRENSAAITKVQSQPGFKELSMTLHKAAFEEMIPDAFQNFTNQDLPSIFGLTPVALSSYLPEMKLLQYSKAVNTSALTLTFANEKGETFMLGFVGIRTDSGNFSFGYGIMRCHFTLAPTIVITQKKKKGFLSSSAWEEISYIPPNISQEDLAGIFGVILGGMSKAVDSITPKLP